MTRPRTIARRELLQIISTLGIGSAVFGRSLVALAGESGRVTPDMIRKAEWISGLELTKAQRKLMADALERTLGELAKLRAVRLDNSVPPAFTFDAEPSAPRCPASMIAGVSPDSHGESSTRSSGLPSEPLSGTGFADAVGVGTAFGPGMAIGPGAGAAAVVGVPASVGMRAGSRGPVGIDAADGGLDTVAARAGAYPVTGPAVVLGAFARGGPRPVERPASDEDLAFASVETLGALLHTRQVSSTELTKLYLGRLRRYDPLLKCVITLTEETALAQAARADAEIAAGRTRGPLHGIPWGAKDLIAAPGAPTTWGAGPFRAQRFDDPAAVVEELEMAGAVLVAKLTVGELAWGDVWFGGKTRNPWKPDQGSSGSSAGSASATAAGLVGFAIGTETWGSIVSPCTRCGATGLRPTFGRVSRHGVMALAWTMDKVGPIARTATDCGTVFAAIHGRDPRDPASVGRPFAWPPGSYPGALRVGYVEELFAEDYTKWADDESEKPGLKEWQEIDRRSLGTLREMGVTLEPIRLPSDLPVGSLSTILTAEAAAAFDELTRSGRDAELVRQIAEAWPTVFRVGQMIPAVEYLRASRIRTLLMRAMERLMADLDVYVAPTFGGDNLLLTNLTGHPCVVLPNGFRPSDGTPTSLSFIGKLHGESQLLALAAAFQNATDFHRRRPRLEHPAAD